MSLCKLSDKPCTGCGECDRCDLDSEKICDNCCQCLDVPDVDYASIPVALDRGDDKPPIKSHPRKRTGR